MKQLFAVFIIYFCFACQPKAIDLGTDFDTAIFKSDRGACLANRSKQIDWLESSFELLLGLSENEIIATLGRYDFQMLDSRNQKVFIYFLEKGPHCETPKQESEAKTMAIYFNATKLVKEVTFQAGIL